MIPTYRGRCGKCSKRLTLEMVSFQGQHQHHRIPKGQEGRNQRHLQGFHQATNTKRNISKNTFFSTERKETTVARMLHKGSKCNKGIFRTHKSRALHERERLGHLRVQRSDGAAALLGRGKGGCRTGKESSRKESELHGRRWANTLTRATKPERLGYAPQMTSKRLAIF